MNRQTDNLTGLSKREVGIDYVEQCIGNNSLSGVAIMDIDFFTNINQRIGADHGDIVLKKIAKLLQQYDIEAARYGGDEFILIFTNYERIKIMESVCDIKRKISSQRMIELHPYEKVPIRVSIGVTVTEDELQQSLTVLKMAETALAMAKKRGRNRIETLENQTIEIIRDSGVCTTIIGKNLRGDSGEGGDAFDGNIREPYGVEVDNSQRILFVDRSNHRIKSIKNSVISTVAGIGESGYSGDHESAVSARLSKPSGVAVDSFGHMYIADTGNHCIRKVENGIISTYAGCGTSGYSGDKSLAIHATLNRPGGVAVDSDGNVYTNDYGNNVVRKIDNSGVITTIAGNGAYGYSGDFGNATDASLNKCYGLWVDSNKKILYLADYDNYCVRGVDLETGIIQTICGTGCKGTSGDGGPAIYAKLEGPFWGCCDEAGNIYIADADANCIRKIDGLTNIITTVAGNKESGYKDSKTSYSKIRMNIPAGLVVKDHILYFADYGNNAIRKLQLK